MGSVFGGGAGGIAPGGCCVPLASEAMANAPPIPHCPPSFMGAVGSATEAPKDLPAVGAPAESDEAPRADRGRLGKHRDATAKGADKASLAAEEEDEPQMSAAQLMGLY